MATCVVSQPSRTGELLYNGIRLPSQWPPQHTLLTLDPSTPPYLESQPDVIPIDVGRQLFVDDFLIEGTTLKRVIHETEYYPHNPVLTPDKPWEMEGGPSAMVFSDGVWYDPKDRLFKVWYMGGYTRSTCYATSTDGIHWTKPMLDVVPGTNIVQAAGRDSTTVWLDDAETDPARRFKLFRSHGDGGWALSIYFSPDGIHWGDAITRSGPCGDRTTVFFNPFRKKWIFGVRGDTKEMGRIRTVSRGRRCD